MFVKHAATIPRRQSGSEAVLILDGAMGTELLRRGVDLPLPLWSAEANLAQPETVKSIHREYVAAGADILTANTFRTTPRAYFKAGYSLKRARQRARESLMIAVDLARSAATTNTLIAGSLAPLEDCYTPELFPGPDAALEEYGELVTWFRESGIDLLLIETMGHREEVMAALNATDESLSPCWVSFILKDGHHLLGGHSLVDTLANVAALGVEAVLLNCNSLPNTRAGIDTLTKHWNRRWGVYPNLGLSQPEPDGTITDLVPLDAFCREAQWYLQSGARILGACCGSTPEYIRKLREIVDRALS